MNVIAGLTQILGVALAPLLVGSIQSLKARLQGRRGPSPLQPYRTFGRLWSKSAVDPEGTGIVYRLAPPLVAACLIIAMLIVPVAAHGVGFGVGHDALVLVGMLALARFAVAAAAWDTSNGFALMGAARDLMIAVFGEALLVLALLVAAIPVHSTDLRSMSVGAAGWHVWSGPTHWCGAVAFALVILVETGRQPVDNPDTHLELTMIHEGPLLEYAGRDLAFLHWAAAARHWVVLLLGAELFLPHPRAFGADLAVLALEVAAVCGALAVIETYEAKMRMLRLPALLGVGCAIALAGTCLGVGGLGT
jgi:formate hydrogenlyase subunit 4